MVCDFGEYWYFLDTGGEFGAFEENVSGLAIALGSDWNE